MLLKGMEPILLPEVFVFCTVTHAKYGDYAECEPFAVIREKEGLTLVVAKDKAAGLDFGTTPMRCISLTVHSSLDAVGLTAAIATKLTTLGISANVIAGFYHDHIFVPANRASDAVAALQSF